MLFKKIYNYLSKTADYLYFFITSSTKGIILLTLIALSYWLFFSLGQIAGFKTQNELQKVASGTKTLEQLMLLTNQGQLSGKLVIGNPVRFIDQYSNLWVISDFTNAISAQKLEQLQSQVEVVGKLKIELQSQPINAHQIALNAFLDTASRLGLATLYLLLLGLIFFYLKNNQTVLFPQSRKFIPKNQRMTFANVAGHHGPKKEVQEVVEYLRDSQAFIDAGAKPPKGVLLYGPPGNGKTLIAKAVAGEAQAHYLEQNASSFVQMYVGVGAMRVRELFKEARKNRPCVIFIDEIDAVGLSRSLGGSNDERLQTVNALLAEMDGFQNNDGIVVIAATNQLDKLDEALVRPGRFDRKVLVPLPNKKDREEILKSHAEKLPNCNANISFVAERTQGFSGADLANLVNEAAVEAARSQQKTVGDIEFQKARERILMGPQNQNMMYSDEERKIIAYHEAGHALIYNLLYNKPVEKISILPRANQLGVSVLSPPDQEHILTKQQFFYRLQVLLAGRASEEVFLNLASTTAQDDLSKAASLANMGLSRFGFSKHAPYCPSETQTQQEAELLLKELYQANMDLLKSHESVIHKIAEQLLLNDEVSDFTLDKR